jgi:hypothetical protein
MNRTFTFLVTLLVASSMFAQSPEKMSYQGVLRNSERILLVNQEVGMQISILLGSADGTPVYTETHTPTTNANGLVTIEIGTGVTSDDFTSIDWSNGTYFVKTETDPSGGTSYSITGTSQLLSVPYSLFSKNAETVTVENDPVFTAWDRSAGISITESQVSDLQNYLTVETDPVFTAWDRSAGISITESQVSDLQNYLTAETDPVYAGSQAANISAADIINLGNLSGINTGDQNIIWETNGSNIYYNDGYVGIGTTTPGAGLGLSSAAGYGSAIGLLNTGGGLEWRLTSWTDGTFRLVKTTGTTFTALMAEPVNGNVGIGTSSPDQKLSVHSASGISYVRVSDNTTGPASGLRMGMSGSGNAYIINDEAARSLSLGTSGTTQMRISDAGYVGINELTPDQMLHLKQDVANRAIRIEHQSTTDYWENGIGTTTRNYKFYYNNLFRADISSVDGAYVQSSDRRLKRDIQYMDPVLEKVMKLKPATYHYTDNDGSAPRSKGFVTQDVEDVFPNLVRDVGDGYSGIVYDGFAVISIKAIQEMNIEMKEMQSKTDQMQAEIEELKRAIETLKKGNRLNSF